MHKKNNLNLENNYEINNENVYNMKDINLNNENRQILVNKLMTKFNLSKDDAEKILNRFEKMHKNQNINNVNYDVKSNSTNGVDNNKNLIKTSSKQNSNENQINVTKKDSLTKIESSTDLNYKVNPNLDNPLEIYNSKFIDNQDSQLPNFNNNDRVDNLLYDIIPDYKTDISIEIEHVNLTFEVSNEKVDTIKESVIRKLKRKKNNKIKIEALKDISFKIFKGEKVGIIGYNGAGKSTLLNVIVGIYPPDNGHVKVTGNISPLLSLSPGFDLNYSGRKNIFLNGAVLGYDKEYLESKVDEIIEFSELGEFIDIPIKNYSSGMLAKLGFSIATTLDPDILIIDEILGVGDVNFQKKSGDRIKSLMDGGTTVLLVSHSIPQIRELCNKAIWIDNGRLREMGEVNNVCDHYLKDAEKATNEQLANIKFK